MKKISLLLLILSFSPAFAAEKLCTVMLTAAEVDPSPNIRVIPAEITYELKETVVPETGRRVLQGNGELKLSANVSLQVQVTRHVGTLENEVKAKLAAQNDDGSSTVMDETSTKIKGLFPSLQLVNPKLIADRSMDEWAILEYAKKLVQARALSQNTILAFKVVCPLAD